MLDGQGSTARSRCVTTTARTTGTASTAHAVRNKSARSSCPPSLRGRTHLAFEVLDAHRLSGVQALGRARQPSPNVAVYHQVRATVRLVSRGTTARYEHARRIARNMATAATAAACATPLGVARLVASALAPTSARALAIVWTSCATATPAGRATIAACGLAPPTAAARACATTRRASVRWATPASIARSARARTIARATASASTGLVCATTASQGATARCSTARAAADGTSTASMARALAVLAGPARIAIYESAQPTATGGATATMARAIAALATAAVLLVETAPFLHSRMVSWFC